jgi:hypothetical protein
MSRVKIDSNDKTVKRLMFTSKELGELGKVD